MIIEECIDEITKLYGHSFYLLDSDVFETNYLEFLKSFRKEYSNFNIAYSYKTNYIPKICNIVNSHGGFAEIVSWFEGMIALKCGVPYEKIIWNGPIKDFDAVCHYLENGAIVNVDNINELKQIQDHFKKTDSKINLGLRCNFDVGDGVISRFGIDILSDDFREALTIFNDSRFVLKCIHCHFARRSIDFWPKRVDGIINVLHLVNESIGKYPSLVDLGGGIYGKMNETLKKQFSDLIPDYSQYAHIVCKKFSEEFPNKEITVLSEPGTALAGNCMRFVGRVEGIKTISQKPFVTIMGSQKNINMTGVNPPISIIKKSFTRKYLEQADFVGYTCIENDVLFRDYCGEIGIGDYVVFYNCGSYSVVMKPPFILPNVPVLDISGKKIELIKRKEEFADLMQTFVF